MSSRHEIPNAPAGGARADSGNIELLYDPNIPALSHAERARTIVSKAKDGMLCTLGSDGFPYGSVVLYDIHESGSPVLLISELAEHTKNLRRDPRCSLFVREDVGASNALARGRVTVVGTAAVVVDPSRELADSFTTRNVNAKQYASFKDFNFWKIVVQSVRYVGGFGRMSWVDLSSWQNARSDPILLGNAEEIMSKLNEPRSTDGLAVVAKAFSRASVVSSVSVSSVDRYGVELNAETEYGLRPIRVAFTRPAISVDDVPELIEILQNVALAS